MSYRIVEQVGDCTFQLNGHTYPSLPEAMLALVDLDDRYSGEDREFFVDGPGLTHPIGVGQTAPEAH